MADTPTRAAVLAAVPALDAPAPALGATPGRWAALFDLASTADVSLARLVEAHIDACAILHEAGREPAPGSLYAVWASVDPAGGGIELVDGRLRGSATFGSGIGIVDRALIDVETGGGRQLCEVVLPRSAGRAAAAAARAVWHHAGMGATATGRLDLDGHTDFEVLAPTGWYLARPGFWHGAVGPVACWAGAAAGLELPPSDDPFRRAARGSLVASRWAMRALLEQAGREADAAPDDIAAARQRGRAIRRVVHELASETADRYVRAAGPRPMVGDPAVAQRLADIQVYLRQHHDERELAELGR